MQELEEFEDAVLAATHPPDTWKWPWEEWYDSFQHGCEGRIGGH